MREPCNIQIMRGHKLQEHAHTHARTHTGYTVHTHTYISRCLSIVCALRLAKRALVRSRTRGNEIKFVRPNGVLQRVVHAYYYVYTFFFVRGVFPFRFVGIRHAPCALLCACACVRACPTLTENINVFYTPRRRWRWPGLPFHITYFGAHARRASAGRSRVR